MTLPEAPAAQPPEPSEPETTPASAHGRAGRNLPVAIAVGQGLGALVLTTLFAYKQAFVVIMVFAIAYATYEVVRSLHVIDLRAPLLLLVVGAVAMIVTAYRDGPENLVVALLLTVI